MRTMRLGFLLAVSGLSAAAQFTSASLTGVVTDSSGASVPAAAVVAQETRTGITTRTASNEEGLYSFPSLPVGRYRVSAEKAGFQKQVYNDIVLEVGGRLSLDFTLSPGQVVEVVEVKAELENVLGVTSTSVGGLVSGQKVLNLPIVSRDALSFVYLQAGVVGNNFAGARRGALNISMDGINIQDNRINSGVASTVSTSIDRVEEFRVVTSPADAEYGRGSGQIQLISRSGTNEFHGSLFEFHRNTAFNANTWFNNQRGLDRNGNQISPRNILLRHQFGARMGGPVIRNRTFFHFLYEGQRQATRNAVTNTVLTEEARRGLFRFFPGARNGNAEAGVPTVDLNGQPLRPAAATGPLASVNLFQVDPARARLDPTGGVAKWLGYTPLPNNFRSGDGLNTAGYTWSRPATNDGDQYVLKLDHNFSTSHRTSFTYQRESSSVLNGFMAQRFPTSPGGTYADRAMLASLAVTSTLHPNLLNEFRGGTQRPRVRFNAPWEVNDGEILPVRGATPYMLVPLAYTSPIQDDQDPQGRISPVYQYADTLTWIKGKHQFKGGAEVRWVSSNGFNSFTVVPRANIGAGVLAAAPVQAIAGIGLNAGLAANILNDLTGTLANSTQAFNATGGRAPQYVAGEPRQRTWRQRELSWFFKDDWKLTPSVTLNLGVRWEYYGQPYEALGRTSRLKNGSSDIFGTSGSDFSSLFRPGLAQGQLVDAILVGRNSPNPGEKLYADDRNNFAPAVGLTWSMPWFGKDKTVLRMGYGWGYERNSLRNLDVFAADLPGLRTVTNFRSSNPLQLANLALPLTPIGAPLERIPLTDRGTTTYAFDSGLRAPYTQNWNFSLQRALVKNTTLEVRYVGSKSTRLLRATNVNETNIFENGILDAFNITQAGGNAPLFDRIFDGLNIAGLGRVNGTTITGSDAMRALQAAAFAGNNTGTIANYLNTNAFAGQPGDLLRRAGLPENFVVVNPQFAGATFLSNFANSTYHSLQVEVIKRYSSGVEFQANWTYSKALGEEEGDSQSLLDSYRTARNRRADKRLLTFNRTHVFRSNWIYELPFGRKGKLFTGANGVVDRLIGGWQVSGIVNLFTGGPITVFSERSSFNNFGGDNTPSAAANIDKSLGQVLKTGNGVVYFNGIRQVTDPSVANMTTRQNIRSTSTLQALVDASGNTILRNAVPGELGNLASTFFTGPGSIRVDMRLAKTIRIRERKEFQLTVDAENLSNTPNFNDPNTVINSINFGRITGAGGNRILLLGGRFNF